MVNPHTVFQRLTTDQAADLAHRHRKTILRALESGELHGSQRVKGGRWLIRPDCLEAFMDGVLCPHQSAPGGAAPYGTDHA